MQNKKHLLRNLVLIVIAAIVLILFILPAFRYLVLDKSAIHREVSNFNLASTFQKQKENYSSGFCFDNCPSTQITYSLPSLPNSKVLDDLEMTFANDGYQHISKSDNTVRGTKDNGRYYVEAFTLKANTYEGVKAAVPVDTLVIRLTYNHNISN